MREEDYYDEYMANDFLGTFALVFNYFLLFGVFQAWIQKILWCPIKIRFFVKIFAAFIASILPWVIKVGESKEGSFHFDEKLSIW